MDIEKLIDRLNQYSQSLIAYKLGADFADACMDAATALSTLQAENEKLRAELEEVKRERDAAQSLLAERIGVRGAEPITTAFGLPLDRLRELAQADREGRCVVLPCKIGDTIYQVDYMTHGEALRAGVPEKNDPRSKRKFGRRKAEYLPLMVREKKMVKSLYSEFGKSVFLTRAEAEAALRREQDG